MPPPAAPSLKRDLQPYCCSSDRNSRQAGVRALSDLYGQDPVLAITRPPAPRSAERLHPSNPRGDRKSTRLNSSHGYISYAVFCLKKKKKIKYYTKYPRR